MRSLHCLLLTKVLTRGVGNEDCPAGNDLSGLEQVTTNFVLADQGSTGDAEGNSLLQKELARLVKSEDGAESSYLATYGAVVTDSCTTLAKAATGLYVGRFCGKKVAVNADVDRFYSGSVSKVVAGTVAAILAAQRDIPIDLMTPASQIIPEYQGTPYADATLHDFFDHNSCIFSQEQEFSGNHPSPDLSDDLKEDYNQAWSDLYNGKITPDEYSIASSRIWVIHTLRRPPAFPGCVPLGAKRGRGGAPQGPRVYSNYALAVGIHMIAKAAGKPFSVLMQERFLEPLGMTSSLCGLTNCSMRLNTVKGPVLVPIEANGAGGWFPHLEDAARFIRFILQGYKGELSPEGLRAAGDMTRRGFEVLLTEDTDGDAPDEIGLSWYIRRDSQLGATVSHGGHGGAQIVIYLEAGLGFYSSSIPLNMSSADLARKTPRPSNISELFDGYPDRIWKSEEWQLDPHAAIFKPMIDKWALATFRITEKIRNYFKVCRSYGHEQCASAPQCQLTSPPAGWAAIDSPLPRAQPSDCAASEWSRTHFEENKSVIVAALPKTADGNCSFQWDYILTAGDKCEASKVMLMIAAGMGDAGILAGLPHEAQCFCGRDAQRSCKVRGASDACHFASIKRQVDSAVMNAGQSCLTRCQGQAGYCLWCGKGMACCQQGDNDPVECIGRGGDGRHECVEVGVTGAIDTPGWINAWGQPCELYAMSYCTDGDFDAFWAGCYGKENFTHWSDSEPCPELSEGKSNAEYMKFPGRNCVVCGEGKNQLVYPPPMCTRLVDVAADVHTNSDYWLTHCKSIPWRHTMLKVRVGGVDDYWRAVGGSVGLCQLLSDYSVYANSSADTRAQWSNDGRNWKTIGSGSDSMYLGGSPKGWPKDNVFGDSREHLAYWGGELASGAWNNSASDWGAALTMYTCEEWSTESNQCPERPAAAIARMTCEAQQICCKLEADYELLSGQGNWDSVAPEIRDEFNFRSCWHRGSWGAKGWEWNSETDNVSKHGVAGCAGESAANPATTSDVSTIIFSTEPGANPTTTSDVSTTLCSTEPVDSPLLENETELDSTSGESGATPTTTSDLSTTLLSTEPVDSPLLENGTELDSTSGESGANPTTTSDLSTTLFITEPVGSPHLENETELDSTFQSCSLELVPVILVLLSSRASF